MRMPKIAYLSYNASHLICEGTPIGPSLSGRGKPDSIAPLTWPVGYIGVYIGWSTGTQGAGGSLTAAESQATTTSHRP
jgi:hypothetical protein